MNKKAESMGAVVIITAALVVIGVLFVSLAGNPSVTSYTTLEDATCYDVNTEKEIETNECCNRIRQSSGCQPNEKLFECGNVIANQQMVELCQNV